MEQKQKQVDFIFTYEGNFYSMIITENPAGLFFNNELRTAEENIEELLAPEVVQEIYNQLNESDLTDEDGNLK